ncbi:RcnB family protein [Kaistia dalseonensis]|uniref:Ni/Co efflux regulator RcnB n=1 Tax=Kaistia dalseonensis TaxID=410840 RepID=A0ABU0H4M0_9HYPH|nr:RcnB family protein [Kaistia dalseonensis]MCX5494674.1 RcnB family protein [Kaistia dalseonensis]MDQ0437255.1 Ni/Co efflux regulator RcnB [Kaistia dalseonensis]
MKRLLLIPVALAMLSVPAANAQSYRGPAQPQSWSQSDRGQPGRPGDVRGQDHVRGHDDRSRYGKPQQRWQQGQRMPRNQWGRDVDYRHHHLKQPPRGYRWVEQGNQYFMIGMANGVIAAIVGAR